ncbi:hypothetical protein E2C01_020505 [Portunus trituberculatus]|uniref:Uncharacterized protein n=1 Tax=Portunus trituberculatus TaxID=210409 RepID=A0A5B7E1W4_PORTR|nr:hypothetical protein [Portunus trituberculatus]
MLYIICSTSALYLTSTGSLGTFHDIFSPSRWWVTQTFFGVSSSLLESTAEECMPRFRVRCLPHNRLVQRHATDILKLPQLKVESAFLREAGHHETTGSDGDLTDWVVLEGCFCHFMARNHHTKCSIHGRTRLSLDADAKRQVI